MKKRFIVFLASLTPVIPAFSQVVENDAPKSSSGSWLLMIIAVIVLLTVTTVWTIKRINIDYLLHINWMLIVANMVVAASPFLTWYSGTFFRRAYTKTILDDKGPGELLIILAALNILFALLRKQIPTIILTLLTALLAAALIHLTCEESQYIDTFRFGTGFYMLIAGIILMVVSYPLSNAMNKKEKTTM